MKKVLGKGLDALVPDSYRTNSETIASTLDYHRDAVAEIDIAQIAQNHEQPRKFFSDSKIEELAQSIQSQGFLQPIIVKRGEQGTYEIICGERRFRAAMKIGKKKIPAIIREATEETLLELALIENIQREDPSGYIHSFP